MVNVNFPCLVVEGLITADGRYIEPGAVSHRALPLSILAMSKTSSGGHDGASVIGKLTSIERVSGSEVINKETGEPYGEGTFVWRGAGELGDDLADTKLVQAGYLTGNSVDFDPNLKFEEIGFSSDDEEPEDGIRIRITEATLSKTTLVPVPAFASAYVQIDGETPVPDEVLAPVAASAAFTVDLMSTPTAANRKRAARDGNALPPLDDDASSGESRFPINDKEDLRKAIAAVGRAKGDKDAVRRHIMKAARKLDAEDMIPETWNSDGSVGKPVQASVTDITSSLPKLSVFSNPELTGKSGLVIDADGRITGHIAVWDQRHISFSGQKIFAPRSRSDYAYFMTGYMDVRDENNERRRAAVGALTISTGHAGVSASHAQATAHYDHTGTVAADIAVGEDEFGIWCSGLIRDLTAAQIRELTASSPSGDWRPIQGNLEMVAVLQVNTPGIPVPRARVASGELQALVAAGSTGIATRVNEHVDLTELVEGAVRKVLTEFNSVAPTVEAEESVINVDDEIELELAAADNEFVSRLKYGRGSSLWKYWTRGKGQARWIGAVDPWQTLVDLLIEETTKAGHPLPKRQAQGLATNIMQATPEGKAAFIRGHSKRAKSK